MKKLAFLFLCVFPFMLYAQNKTDKRPADNTFDLVTWNLDWFGTAGVGPENDEEQVLQVMQTLEELHADVYVLEEVANSAYFENMLGFMEDYEGLCSPAVSGGRDGGNAQKVCFVFNRHTVKPKGLKPLLAGTPKIEDYPESFDRFWASGRYPALFSCEVEIAGQKQELKIVGIHARANRNTQSRAVYDMRKMDVQVLKDSLDKYYGNDPVILAGDFNDDVDESVVEGETRSTYWPFLNDPRHWELVTKPLSEEGRHSFIGYKNIIDHIAISDELFSHLVPGTVAVYALKNGEERFKKEVSDHLPVLCSFSFSPDVIGKKEVLEFPNRFHSDFKLSLPKALLANLKIKNEKQQILLDITGNEEELHRHLNETIALLEEGQYIIQIFIGNTAFSYKIVKMSQ
ncbi:endonuclease/exonuclease/phosphatase family protein [Marinilongibacter aquaticus]|uniref:endonuclease/exonuclease/phosphatase family protein n=1 Tax=Marinilongibacter aquaticus TaxID=2975157 RepID=UPI0021BD16B6|nr:endonuclease/exonuclease/phosphatase family protein [Marinilongibacter aquaticus]UBM58535.1 endonuclease/exonuclease/phosphatase family protein [Marinilongibacter aquaticus]